MKTSLKQIFFFGMIILGVLSLTNCKKESQPIAGFTFSGDNLPAPCEVSFNNSSQNATSYSWDFGDGQSSILENTTHVYTKGGSYNVTLVAKNSVGNQNIINKTVAIKDAPTKLKVNSLNLTGMPFTTPSGGGWDISSGPDVYFEFSDDNSNVYFTSGVYNNLLQSELPKTYTLGFPITINSLDFKYTIEFYDEDVIGSEWIGGYYFTVRNSMPTDGSGYPSTINFNSTSLKFTLNVEWL